MNFPTEWDSNILAEKDYRKLEKIKLDQSEQKSIKRLKSILNPFLEITELLKGSSYGTYSLMNPALLEIKNNFHSEGVDMVEINFEDKESSFDNNSKRIPIDEPVDCNGLINNIKLSLSATIDNYWKDLSGPKTILFSLLDP